MKRTLKSIVVLALSALAMVSCQKELLGPATQEGQEVEVSLDLTTPLMGTKAYADGTTVDVVHVHVYQKDASGNLTYIAPAEQENDPETPSKDVTMSSNCTATYSTRLVTGQTYTFVFWAEKKDNGHYTYNPETKNVTVSYTNAAGNPAAGNDESRDAFYAVLPNVTINGAYSASVTLNRPFAQINFGASDDEVAKAAGITVTGAAVKLTNVANSLNLLDGSVSGSETVTFANADLPTDPATLTAAGVDYKYVAMDYVLVGKNAKTLSDVTLTLTLKADGTLSTTPEHKYPNVPLKGNYRTNIVGYLFTSPADINIKVEPGFGNPDENIVAQNVASIADANEALSHGATSVTIANVTASEAGTTNLKMPATSENITVTIEAIESTANLQIEEPSAGANPESVSVVLPARASVSNLTINLPHSHVEVNGASYTSINATTSNNTLVIGSDVKVTTLTIEAGAVEIYGEVGTLTKGTNAGDVKVWAVGDKATFSKAYSAGAQTIELKNDITDFTSVIEIGRNLNLDGNGFAIHNTANRVVRITQPNLTVNFTDLALVSKCTATSDVRCVSFDNIASNANVLFDNCELSASFYCINVVAGPQNLNVTLKNATVAAGWAAINCYANNSTFTIENSTLKGLNDKGESSWNDFATIVFDGNGLWDAANIGVNGTGNKLNVVNSTIYASSESSNNQSWLALQYGAQRNIVKVDAATRIIDAAGNDQTGNVCLAPVVGWNNTTQTYTSSYDLESEIWLAGQNAFPGFYKQDGVYHINSTYGLQYFSDKVTEYNVSYAGEKVLLEKDLDMSGIEFTPIGQTGATQFQGTFDGQCHTISNLSINNTDEGGNCATGLFGWLNTAVVKDVNISGANITGYHNVGTIAGYLEGSGCTIEGCTVDNATISCTSANDDANGDKCGGIVGHAGNAGVLVKGCVVSKSTISAGRDAGQVVGAAKEANVENCSADNVTVTADGTSTGANISNAVIGRIL